MIELREQIAKALWEAEGLHFIGWDNVIDEIKDYWRKEADAMLSLIEAHIREAQAVAIRKAADTICCFCAEGIPYDGDGHIGERHCYAHAILALAAQKALRKVERKARLDEVELWKEWAALARTEEGK